MNIDEMKDRIARAEEIQRYTENRCTSLEKENAELKAELKAIDEAGEHARKQITESFRNKKPYWELEKENAELKEKLNFSTQYYQGEKAKEQLTKAKELLGKLLVYLKCQVWIADKPIMQKDIAEAEQFLSEVEK